MEVRTVRLGARDMTYRAAGSGPTVVLLHGMAGSSQTWEPVIGRLAARASVLAIDLPGHGGSTNPGGDYSLGAHASCVRDLMVALGVERATIVGHSYGGGVAMQTAYQFPERCERLVLVDSGGLGPEVAGWMRALSLPGAELALTVGCSEQVVRAGNAIARVLKKVGLEPAPSKAAIYRSMASLTTTAARASMLRTLRGVINPTGQTISATDRLGWASLIPTLIVWGEQDRIIPVAHARAAHDAIAGSTLEIVEGAGHFPHLDDPDRFVTRLGEFLDTSEPAALTAASLRDLIPG